jgi:hypothetical protein
MPCSSLAQIKFDTSKFPRSFNRVSYYYYQLGASCTAILAKCYLDDLAKDAMRKACGMFRGTEETFVEMSERTMPLRKHRYGKKNNIRMDLQGILW